MSIGRLSAAATLTLTILLSATANAQQINGVPGSPSATTTLSGKQARFLQAYLSLKLPILALLHVRGSLTMSLPG
jgi:hypothetical protein